MFWGLRPAQNQVNLGALSLFCNSVQSYSQLPRSSKKKFPSSHANVLRAIRSMFSYKNITYNSLRGWVHQAGFRGVHVLFTWVRVSLLSARYREIVLLSPRLNSFDSCLPSMLVTPETPDLTSLGTVLGDSSQHAYNAKSSLSATYPGFIQRARRWFSASLRIGGSA